MFNKLSPLCSFCSFRVYTLSTHAHKPQFMYFPNFTITFASGPQNASQTLIIVIYSILHHLILK